MNEHTYILTYNSLFVYMHTYRQTDIQADRQTVRQSVRQTERQEDRQTDRKTDFLVSMAVVVRNICQVCRSRFFVIGEKVKKMLKVKELSLIHI